MTRSTALAVTALAGVALAGCAAPRPISRGFRDPASRERPASAAADGPEAVEPDPAPGSGIVARARGRMGQRGPFLVGGARFGADCSGFVSAVYEAEGIPLRALMRAVAPDERSGTAAAYRAAEAYGEVFGEERSPAPGDLVFWHDTYDRNRNHRVDDPFTHVGLVEAVDGGTVAYLHRGSRGVTRGFMTLARPDEADDAFGRALNSPLREKNPHLAGAPHLAGELFAGFGRIDARRLPGGAPLPVAAR